MNIFEEVKSYVTATQVAERYGIKVGINKMACCPFHDDKHPSMKVDENYFYCFGCGAHGDAIGLVAQLHGIGQYEGAKLLIDEYGLPIEKNHRLTGEEKKTIKKIGEQKNYQERVKKKFESWRNESIDELRDTIRFIETVKESLNKKEYICFVQSNEFEFLLRKESIVEYWLDILCLGTDTERRELFFAEGREVKRIAASIKRTGNEILGRVGKRAG